MKTLALAAPSTEKITEQELCELVIGAIDTAQASIEDVLSENLQYASPKNRNYDSSMLSDVVTRLNNITVADLDFSEIYRTEADLTVADLVIAVVAAVEPMVHPPNRLQYNSQRKKSGECYGCNECFKVVVKTLMDRVGIARAASGAGSSVPSPGIYCAPTLPVLRNGIHLSWPGAAMTPALIKRRAFLRLSAWDLDSETRQVLREIGNEVLARSEDETNRSIRRTRQIRKGIRRILKQRLREGTAESLDAGLVQLHPWAPLIDREGWPGFWHLATDLPVGGSTEVADSSAKDASRLLGSAAIWFKKVVRILLPQRRPRTKTQHHRRFGVRWNK